MTYLLLDKTINFQYIKTFPIPFYYNTPSTIRIVKKREQKQWLSVLSRIYTTMF